MALANSPETKRIKVSLAVSESGWLGELTGFVCAWALSDGSPATGKMGISSSEGKLSAGFSDGRRLLTRGTSASAKSKKARGMANQFDIPSTNHARAPARGTRIPYSMMRGGG